MTIGEQIDRILAVKTKINRIVYGDKPTLSIVIDNENNVTCNLYANKYHGRGLVRTWRYKKEEVEGYDKLALSFERQLREGGAIIDEPGEKIPLEIEN